MNQQQRYPYSVIIIGSGCSFNLGVPTMEGFMDKVFEKLSSSGIFNNDGKESLEKITKFIQKVKGSAAYIRSDLLNIEELYGLADMEKILKKGNRKNIECLKAFNRAIFEVTRTAGEEFLNDTEANRFQGLVSDIENIKRESQTSDPLYINMGSKYTNLLAYLCLASHRDGDNTQPMFVQFNWDIALDRAIRIVKNTKTVPTNDIDDYPWYKEEVFYNENPAIVRPHGGINWVNTAGNSIKYRTETNTWIPIVDTFQQAPNDANGNSDTNSETKPKTALYFAPQSLHINYKIPNIEDMAIIPPTWNKIIRDEGYILQWNRMKKALEKARQIIFIGYSLPKSDLYFRHFLALSLTENQYLPKVYIWNPKIQTKGSPERESYLDLFAPLVREGRVFAIDKFFGDPALFDLHRAIYNAVPVSNI